MYITVGRGPTEARLARIATVHDIHLTISINESVAKSDALHRCIIILRTYAGQLRHCPKQGPVGMDGCCTKLKLRLHWIWDIVAGCSSCLLCCGGRSSHCCLVLYVVLILLAGNRSFMDILCNKMTVDNTQN